MATVFGVKVSVGVSVGVSASDVAFSGSKLEMFFGPLKTHSQRQMDIS
jgi:hypothetical protein